MTMSGRRRRSTRVLILLAVLAVLGAVGVGGFFLWKQRKTSLLDEARRDGLAAFEAGDWARARLLLGRAVGGAAAPEADLLEKYALANLRVAPLPAEAPRQAAGALRQLLRLRPTDDVIFRTLARIYDRLGSHGEIESIALARLNALPGDPLAVLWEARSLVARRKPAEARDKLAELLERANPPPPADPATIEARVLLSELIVTSASPGDLAASAEAAVAVLDPAVASAPDHPLPLAQRASMRRVQQTRSGAADPTIQAAIDADLEAAGARQQSDARVPLMLAEEWLQRRDWARAAAALAAADQVAPEVVSENFLDPGDWYLARFRIGALLCLRSGDVAEGQRRAEAAAEALKGRPHLVDALPHMVELLLLAGRVDEAAARRDEFEALTRAVSETPEVRLQRAYLGALIARARGRTHEVINLLEPVAENPLAAAIVRVLLAEAYVQSGQTARMQRILSGVSAAENLDPRLLRTLAEACLREGDWARAAALLGRIPGGEDADLELTRLKAALGQQLSAGADAAQLRPIFESLMRLSQSAPQREDVRLVLAAAHDAVGDTAAAEAALRDAMEACDRPPATLLSLADLLDRTGRSGEGDALLMTATELHPQRFEAWDARLRRLAAQRRWDDARGLYAQALAAITNPAEVRKLRVSGALLEFDAGRPEVALTALRELAAADASDIGVRGLLLTHPTTMADPAAAQKLVDDIRQVEGEGGVVWRLHQSRVWLARGDWTQKRKEIEAMLRQCIDANPVWEAPVLALGAMYERAGEPEAAELVYLNALRSQPGGAATERLLTLYERTNRFDDARQLLARLESRLAPGAAAAVRLRLALREERVDDALREIDLRLAGSGGEPIDLIQKAELLAARGGDTDESLRLLAEAERMGADELMVARARVRVLVRGGREADGIAVLDTLVGAQPRVESHLLRAAFLERLGDLARAEADFAAIDRLATDERGAALLGDFYARTGRTDRAIETWESGLKRFPAATTLMRGLAKVLVMRRGEGDFDRADALLTQLQKDAPDDGEVLLIRALERTARGGAANEREARALLRQAVASPVARADVYRGWGELSRRLGDPEAGRALVMRGLSVYSGDPELLLIRAQIELDAGRLDEARTSAEQAQQRVPDSRLAMQVLLEVAVRRGDQAALRSGLEQVREWRSAAPQDAELAIIESRILSRTGAGDAAREALRATIAAHSGAARTRALLDLFELELTERRFDPAAEALHQAETDAPDDPVVVRARLRWLAAQEKYDELIAALRGDRLAASFEAQRQGVGVLAAAGRVNEAVAAAGRAVALRPDDVEARLLLGDLCYQTGDLDGAERAYRAAAESDPPSTSGLNNLAWVLTMHRQNHAEALQLAHRAVAADPADVHLRDTLATILMNLGQLSEARDELRRGLKLAPAEARLAGERAQMLLKLARIGAKMNDAAGVREALGELATVESATPTLSEQDRAEVERLGRAAEPGR